jgi:hypothetical protein
MRRMLVLAVVTAAAFGGGGASGATHPMLVAKVGLHDAYKINLAFPSGRRVRTLRRGTYTIVVHDYSTIHNFALGSVTQNRRIFTGSVRGVGTKTYTVSLRPGMYAYACSAHPFVMNGRFTVTVG